jgi:hypothetical protein
MTKTVLKITDITVITVEPGMARVCFHTDLPEPAWPYKGRFTAMGFFPRDIAVDWVAEHFPGVPVKLIEG